MRPECGRVANQNVVMLCRGYVSLYTSQFDQEIGCYVCAEEVQNTPQNCDFLGLRTVHERRIDRPILLNYLFQEQDMIMGLLSDLQQAFEQLCVDLR